MLPKSQRLNLKTDFKITASGKKIETKFLNLFIRVGDNQTARVGIATSSKIFKKAHSRNRARRVVSACFESLYAKLPSNINIVALPKVGADELKSGDLLLELDRALKKEKIIND